MMKFLSTSLLVLVSLVNVTNVDVAEFFSETNALKTCLSKVSSNGVAALASEEIPNDCGDSHCNHESHAATHHCHVGHCQFIATANSYLISVPNFILSTRLDFNSILQSILPSGPIKPPKA